MFFSISFGKIVIIALIIAVIIYRNKYLKAQQNATKKTPQQEDTVNLKKSNDGTYR